jgi:molybdopterin-guanine dinucleotide biosynthesis protein A
MATIILAGGSSDRMGQDKASIAIEGSTILQALVCRFADGLGPVIVVGRQEQGLEVERATVVHDIYQQAGPLGGLHAGLLASPDEESFVLACDMPFADPELARYMLTRLSDHDAVVPVLERGPEPLFAVYRKSCLGAVESSIAAGRLRMRDALERLDVLYVPEDKIRERDPDLRSFVNINTPEDYLTALRSLQAL